MYSPEPVSFLKENGFKKKFAGQNNIKLAIYDFPKLSFLQEGEKKRVKLFYGGLPPRSQMCVCAER